jgi:D-alanine transaminase
MLLYNGKLMKEDDIHISPMDRGYYFGDGIYEVFRVYGGRLFEVESHLRRLYRSAEQIRLTLPGSREQLLNDLHHLIEANELQEGIVYIQFTRGEAPRAHGLPSGLEPIMLGWCKELSRPVEQMSKGISAILRPDIRWHRCDIKSLNLLPNSMLKQEAADLGADEVILHRDGVVTECSSSNAMIVKNAEIITHPANHYILHGITREVTIKLAHDLGLAFTERTFTTDELLEADEVFITSTTIEIMPVIQLDGRTVADGHPGPITRKLQEAFEARLGM